MKTKISLSGKQIFEIFRIKLRMARDNRMIERCLIVNSEDTRIIQVIAILLIIQNFMDLLIYREHSFINSRIVDKWKVIYI